MSPWSEELSAALSSPDGGDTVAEGLARGDLHVANRFVVSPGGLRWAPRAELVGWLIDEDAAADGLWLLGTGVVEVVS